MNHRLKSDPLVFQAVVDGTKTHEYRLNDRAEGYRVGDTLTLLECSPGARRLLTGRSCDVDVVHIDRGPGYGIPSGYVVMSIRRREGFPPWEDAAPGEAP